MEIETQINKDDHDLTLSGRFFRSLSASFVSVKLQRWERWFRMPMVCAAKYGVRRRGDGQLTRLLAVVSEAQDWSGRRRGGWYGVLYIESHRRDGWKWR
jgi:hypothetical protein